jgi:hypothetical protein
MISIAYPYKMSIALTKYATSIYFINKNDIKRVIVAFIRKINHQRKTYPQPYQPQSDGLVKIPKITHKISS